MPLSLSLSLFLSFLSLRLLADLTQTVLNQVRRCWLTVDIQLSTDPCPPLTLSIGSSHELHVAARGGVIRRIPLISAPASKRRILIKEGMHQDAPRPSSIFLSFFFIFIFLLDFCQGNACISFHLLLLSFFFLSVTLFRFDLMKLYSRFFTYYFKKKHNEIYKRMSKRLMRYRPK
jgi:hypothetical protein